MVTLGASQEATYLTKQCPVPSPQCDHTRYRGFIEPAYSRGNEEPDKWCAYDRYSHVGNSLRRVGLLDCWNCGIRLVLHHQCLCDVRKSDEGSQDESDAG
jgi:hypothetical protein